MSLQTDDLGLEMVVARRIEAVPVGPAHLRNLVLCMLLAGFDGYDIASMGLAVPLMAHDWKLPAGAFGTALAIVMIGSAVGGITLGWLGDKIGRKPMIVASALVVGLASLGATTAADVVHISVWRFLMGVGFGIGLPNVYALVGDIIPPHRRAFCTTLLAASTSLGGMSGGLVAPQLSAWLGWQGIFIFGGVAPLVLALVMVPALRESPRVLAARGDLQRLTSSLAAFGIDNTSLPLSRSQILLRRVSPLELLRNGLLPISLLYLLSYIICGFAYQTLANWLPSLLTQSGWSSAAAQRSITVLYGGSMVGGLVISWLMDRMPRRGLLVPATVFAAGAILCLAVGYWFLSPALFLLLAGLALAVGGGQYVLPAVAVRLYPPGLLATALSWFGPLSRLGGISGSLVGGWLLLANWSGAQVVMTLSVSPALCAIVLVALSLVAVRRQGAVVRTSGA